MPVEGTEPLEGVSDSTQRDILEMPYAEMTKTWTKLSLIAGHAQRDPELQFTSLAHLLNEEFVPFPATFFCQKMGLRFAQELAPSFPLSGSLRKVLDSALKLSNNG